MVGGKNVFVGDRIASGGGDSCAANGGGIRREGEVGISGGGGIGNVLVGELITVVTIAPVFAGKGICACRTIGGGAGAETVTACGRTGERIVGTVGAIPGGFSVDMETLTG
jgi:hypothetical protein